MRNFFDGFFSGFDIIGERISEFKEWLIGII